MTTITPFLWFDDNLEEALTFYATVFDDMMVMDLSRIGPAGTDPLFSARFRIHGQDLLAINGGAPADPGQRWRDRERVRH
jgi:predicted 3-demethylubiquinone-9 3-methyltransferase (glyoxalase superfamily)